MLSRGQLLSAVFSALMCCGHGALSVAGQLPGSPEYLIDVWDTDSGLPHSTVTSIAQTPDGYLWVGTQLGGLARFDGVRFVTFHPGNTAALQSLEVRQLLVDPGGTLWVGTQLGGLARFDGVRFVTFHPGNTAALQSLEVRQLLVDPGEPCGSAWWTGICCPAGRGAFTWKANNCLRRCPGSTRLSSAEATK